MNLFKRHLEDLDEMTKFGFELAIRYAKLAKENDIEIIEFLEKQLRDWKKP